MVTPRHCGTITAVDSASSSRSTSTNPTESVVLASKPTCWRSQGERTIDPDPLQPIQPNLWHPHEELPAGEVKVMECQLGYQLQSQSCACPICAPHVPAPLPSKMLRLGAYCCLPSHQGGPSVAGRALLPHLLPAHPGSHCTGEGGVCTAAGPAGFPLPGPQRLHGEDVCVCEGIRLMRVPLTGPRQPDCRGCPLPLPTAHCQWFCYAVHRGSR